MMKIFVIFCLMLSQEFCCGRESSSMEQPLLESAYYEKTDVETINGMSCLVKADALDFYTKMSSLFATDNDVSNPFERFFSYVLFGRLFNIPRFSEDDDFTNSVCKISSVNTRIFFRVFSECLIDIPYQFNNRFLNEFKQKYYGLLELEDSNIFAQFIIGFLDYIDGIDNSNENQKESGFKLLELSAINFCLPAARIVYIDDGDKLDIFSEILANMEHNKQDYFEKFIIKSLKDKSRLFIDHHFYKKFQNRFYFLFSDREKTNR